MQECLYAAVAINNAIAMVIGQIDGHRVRNAVPDFSPMVTGEPIAGYLVAEVAVSKKQP